MSKLQEVIKPRVLTAHKGEYGKILVVGGSKDYIGAPFFVAASAYAAGADLVYVAAPEKTAWALSAMSPLLITHKLRGDHLSVEHVNEIVELAKGKDVVVIGNGVGETREAIAAMLTLVKRLEKEKIRMILDADALKLGYLPKGAIITPHTREFQNLFKVKIPQDAEKRRELVKKQALASKTTILLKGPVDTITDGKRLEENTTHNPEMTVGGTGDTLAGILATFYAQSGKPVESAAAAAWVNGTAGDLCLKRRYRVLPDAMIQFIPEAIQTGL